MLSSVCLLTHKSVTSDPARALEATIVEAHICYGLVEVAHNATQAAWAELLTSVVAVHVVAAPGAAARGS